MKNPDPTVTSEQAWPTEQAGPGPAATERHTRPALTWGQRWLVRATASAVLLSGLNALLQVWKVIIECCIRHW